MTGALTERALRMLTSLVASAGSAAPDVAESASKAAPNISRIHPLAISPTRLTLRQHPY